MNYVLISVGEPHTLTQIGNQFKDLENEYLEISK